jgi:hypothetical protein
VSGSIILQTQKPLNDNPAVASEPLHLQISFARRVARINGGARRVEHCAPQQRRGSISARAVESRQHI